jgi:hypothetical protein
LYWQIQREGREREVETRKMKEEEGGYVEKIKKEEENGMDERSVKGIITRKKGQRRRWGEQW